MRKQRLIYIEGKPYLIHFEWEHLMIIIVFRQRFKFEKECWVKGQKYILLVSRENIINEKIRFDAPTLFLAKKHTANT